MPAHLRPPVTVVGAGYVGLVTAVGLARLGHDVRLVERSPDRLDSLRAGRIPIHEAGLQEAFDDAVRTGRLQIHEALEAEPGIVLICVGTPIDDAGRSDLSQLSAALAIGNDVAWEAVVIRSTLPVGDTALAVASAGLGTDRVFTNPEFLSQGSAMRDFQHPSRIVIGRFPNADPVALSKVEALYDGVDAPRMVVDVEAGEIIKNGANAFLALKLSFTNEISSLCEEAGVDVGDVLAGISADARIGGTYMRPSFGFGGSCLPKELATLATAGRALGLAMHVTSAASAANLAAQDRFCERVLAAAGDIETTTVGLLGLAFKAGTDDIRDSPAIRLATRLLSNGYRVRAYDPAAGANAHRQLPALELVDDPAGAVIGAGVVVIATEWPEFADLPWATWAAMPPRPIIVDGRRLLDAEALRGLGYRVIRLGDGRAGTRPLVAGLSATP